MQFKQAIVMRKDLDLSQGKKMSQACHACLGAARNADDNIEDKWIGKGGKKSVLVAEGRKKLLKLHKEARSQGLPAYLVKDAGKTETEPGTVTCLGVGPGEEQRVDKVTGELKLL